MMAAAYDFVLLNGLSETPVARRRIALALRRVKR
jgi:hypothetical protein